MKMTLDEISSAELLLAFFTSKMLSFLVLMKNNFVLECFVTVVTKWQ